MTALFVAYLLATRLARGRPTWAGLAIVLGFAAAFQALAALGPYSLSGDVYSYAIYGRIYAVYGGNPYVEVPAQYPGDPFFDYVFWKYAPSFYGPLWTLLSGVVALMAGANVGLSVLLFRGIAALSAVGAAATTFLVVRRFDPERALTATALVGWCPFVVLECGLGAHNDALMAVLLLLSLAFAWYRWPTLSVAALVLAAGVKLSALALAPLLGLYFLRVLPSWPARFGALFRSTVVALLLAWVIVLPVWAGPETFSVGTLGSGADRYVNSLAEPALGEIRVWLGESREALEVPLNFSGWWLGSFDDSPLYADREGTDLIRVVPAWSNLLVVAPEREHVIRVFDPEARVVGYLNTRTLGPIDPPPELLDDPEVAAKMRGPLGTWQLEEANRLIRLVGWGAYGLAFVVALILGTGSAARLTAAWVALCAILCAVTLTWFWPWYVLWGLLPAALVPRSRVARLTVLLAWGVMLVYVGLGYADTSLWFLNSYRSIAMFGFPLVLFLADEILAVIVWGARKVVPAVHWRRRGAAAPALVTATPPKSVGAGS